MNERFERFRRGRAGQALVEYAILVAAIVSTVFLVIDFFMNSVAAYHQDVTSVICLPVP